MLRSKANWPWGGLAIQMARTKQTDQAARQAREEQAKREAICTHRITVHQYGYLVVDVSPSENLTEKELCENCADRIELELTEGSGLVVLLNAIQNGGEELRGLKGRLMELSTVHGVRGECPGAHMRVWNLASFGNPFLRLVERDIIFTILSRVLGDDFQLGSLSGNILGPGSRAGPVHVDWPYSVLKRFPVDTLACQVTCCLDDFTRENGATQVYSTPCSPVPHSAALVLKDSRDDGRRGGRCAYTATGQKCTPT